MSHIVTIETQVRDATAVRAACDWLSLPAPEQKTVTLFSGAATGLAIQLSGWHYPVVCDTASGQVRFDNYEGRWGDRSELDRFFQAYAIEKARIEARRNGHTLTEHPLENGSVQLTIQVGGAA